VTVEGVYLSPPQGNAIRAPCLGDISTIEPAPD